MQLDFDIPQVLYYGEWNRRYYLILTKVPGQTLHDAWPNINEEAKRKIVCRTTNICKDLARLHSNRICGIDGGQLSDTYLAKGLSEDDYDYDPNSLLENSRELGMDCSTFVFFHCDLGPGNILVDSETGSLAIIDWECTGFVPKEWIMTKFRVSAGLDFNGPDEDSSLDWRKRMARQLYEEGFSDVAETFWVWKGF